MKSDVVIRNPNGQPNSSSLVLITSYDHTLFCCETFGISSATRIFDFNSAELQRRVCDWFLFFIFIFLNVSLGFFYFFQGYDEIIRRVPPHYKRTPESLAQVSEAIFSVFSDIGDAEKLAAEVSRPFFL